MRTIIKEVTIAVAIYLVVVLWSYGMAALASWGKPVVGEREWQMIRAILGVVITGSALIGFVRNHKFK